VRLQNTPKFDNQKVGSYGYIYMAP
jgi:hypothetical protein